jgi:BirA family biotin operon repressor/biotin-[acetyl-CoA-carboxylase] ligase
MDISREHASKGESTGSVVVADFQEAGRGRGCDRSWEMEEQQGLSFTLLLRFPRIEDIPPALTLRVGLAVSCAVEEFSPTLKEKVFVKWPNDIIIDSRKIAGILCEADGGNVHVGIGINVAQKQFPQGLVQKATSIALAAGTDIMPDARFCLLEKILTQLYRELNSTSWQPACWQPVSWQPACWQRRLEQRLYKKGEQVVFIPGIVGNSVADNDVAGNEAVHGILTGIGSGGELLITPDGEPNPRPFITGELKLF